MSWLAGFCEPSGLQSLRRLVIQYRCYIGVIDSSDGLASYSLFVSVSQWCLQRNPAIDLLAGNSNDNRGLAGLHFSDLKLPPLIDAGFFASSIDHGDSWPTCLQGTEANTGFD
jgi:hypothetical protein